ncbi:chemotaxis protein CheX [Methylogaea oryzae]|uniref:CheY-P-specific phosphatase CheC n=1 Tax=Methylogaea oryzae TaxID=1295382 RepID=A0A8D5AFZ7_9GAMM|nr:chemotaxis protein CheX [Methylogaea oryzae]BBL69838.1 CheY-P-specific phosphatase CheC [Methylogaea oryzae]
MSEAFLLTPLEQDALTELFNIGVGYAASAMNELLNEELRLSVPSIEVLPRQSLSDALQLQSKSICGVHQSVSGLFSANAHLLFPEDESLELVKLMLGESVPHNTLTEMQQEALCEIGNIILNACVGAMANTMENECHASLPSLFRGSMEQVLGYSEQGGEDLSLVIFIDFLAEKRQIRGYLVFLLDTISLVDLKAVLGAFLEKIGA